MRLDVQDCRRYNAVSVRSDLSTIGSAHKVDGVVVSWGSSRLDLFAAGVEGDPPQAVPVLHKWWDGSTYQPSWTDWESLGGTSTPYLWPTAVSMAPGRLDVFRQ